MTKDTWLNVQGMSCASCVRHVQTALSKLEGVQNVDVKLEEGRVHVQHDERTRTEALLTALDEAGYESSLTPAPSA